MKLYNIWEEMRECMIAEQMRENHSICVRVGRSADIANHSL